MRHLFAVCVSLATCAIPPCLAAAAQPTQPQLPRTTAQEALAQSKQRSRYLFVLLFDARNAAYRKLRQEVRAAMGGMTKKADFLEVDASTAEGKSLRQKHGMTQDPLPIVLAIAPSGAMTRAYEGVCSPYHLESAIVSRATAELTHVLRQDVTAILLFTSASFPDRKAARGASIEFAASLSKPAKLIEVDPRDGSEAELLTRCHVPATTAETRAIVLRHGYFGRPLVSPKRASQFREVYAAIEPEGCTCAAQGQH